MTQGGACKPCRKCAHICARVAWVYPLIFIGVSIILFVIPVVGILALPLAACLGFLPKYCNRQKESLRLFEEEARVRNLTLHTVEVTNTSGSLPPVKTYVAECPCSDDNKRTILYVHGVRSGAYQFFDTLLAMRALGGFHGFAITMPCWGISDTPSGMSQMSIREITEWHGNVIAEVCEHFNLPSDTVIVSHSFGGMAAVNFAHAHPDKLSALVTMACPGLLPTLGHKGWLWGIFFKLRIPEMWYNGYLGLLYCAPMYLMSLYQKWSGLDMAEFWIRSRPELYGHHLCARYIGAGALASCWNAQYLSKLARVKARVGVIYMKEDSIIPAHQGGLLHLGLGIPYDVLEGNDHQHCEGLDAIAMTLRMISSARHVAPHSVAFAEAVGKYKSHENPTSIAPCVAGDMLQGFYRSTLEKLPASTSGANVAMEENEDGKKTQ